MLPLEARETVSDRGFEGCDFLAGVGDHTAEPCMQLAPAGDAGYFCDIARVEAAAGQDSEAISRSLNERSKNRCAHLSIGSAA